MAEVINFMTSDFVHVFVRSKVNSFVTERKFPKSLTIGELKNKLELLTGAASISMEVDLLSKDKKFVCKLDNPLAKIGSYPIDDNMILQVVDMCNERGIFEDVSQVDKFELSPESYSKRTDTVKSFLAKNKIGKYNEEEMKKREEDRQKLITAEAGLAKEIKVEDRCEVKVLNQPARRGGVKFVGEVHFKPGLWVGIQYDEPLGKNDGSVDGKRYFNCEPKYGSFVKPADIKVGDYPEESFELDEI